MKQQATITPSGFDAMYQAIAFYHAPGFTKWLHCIYDIDAGKASYRLTVMRGRGNEQAAGFDTLDEAVEAYNAEETQEG